MRHQWWCIIRYSSPPWSTEADHYYPVRGSFSASWRESEWRGRLHSCYAFKSAFSRNYLDWLCHLGCRERVEIKGIPGTQLAWTSRLSAIRAVFRLPSTPFGWVTAKSRDLEIFQSSRYGWGDCGPFLLRHREPGYISQKNVPDRSRRRRGWPST